MPTLDEYLDEVDRWKAATQAELENLTAEERAERLLKIQREFERRIGRPFKEVSATETVSTAEE